MPFGLNQSDAAKKKRTATTGTTHEITPNLIGSPRPHSPAAFCLCVWKPLLLRSHRPNCGGQCDQGCKPTAKQPDSRRNSRAVRSGGSIPTHGARRRTSGPARASGPGPNPHRPAALCRAHVAQDRAPAVRAGAPPRCGGPRRYPRPPGSALRVGATFCGGGPKARFLNPPARFWSFALCGPSLSAAWSRPVGPGLWRGGSVLGRPPARFGP